MFFLFPCKRKELPQKENNQAPFMNCMIGAEWTKGVGVLLIHGVELGVLSSIILMTSVSDTFVK